ncbi:hypothetical protein [Siccirubricoccus sp. G192]|uniref:hypothetical protein n=1 Tax=Siccirubricoccus sp. G192 TaxID=2849651 RepID=UPI001C2BB529|nr:hypothetical protein [Siccirubricoccus sp. G192]MBV1799864.1 hypothetical protein [Siccirubricoccus sp. G192]
MHGLADEAFRLRRAGQDGALRIQNRGDPALGQGRALQGLRPEVQGIRGDRQPDRATIGGGRVPRTDDPAERDQFPVAGGIALQARKGWPDTGSGAVHGRREDHLHPIGGMQQRRLLAEGGQVAGRQGRRGGQRHKAGAQGRRLALHRRGDVARGILAGMDERYPFRLGEAPGGEAGEAPGRQQRQQGKQHQMRPDTEAARSPRGTSRRRRRHALPGRLAHHPPGCPSLPGAPWLMASAGAVGWNLTIARAGPGEPPEAPFTGGIGHSEFTFGLFTIPS